jgi:hypothetical protein
MRFFQQWGQFMMFGANAFARWEIDNANSILRSRKRLLVLFLCLLPVILGGIAFADPVSDALPELLGGKKAYSPAFYSTGIFIVSILIGMGAGLITGCIGAGGGFIIAPALMSAGIKGILAVGTDLFHIFAKAIMGSVIHRKLGNVSVPLARCLPAGGHHRRHLGRRHQPRSLRDQPGPQRRLHHHRLRPDARVFGHLRHDGLSQGT